MLIYAGVFLSITIAFTFASSGITILPAWTFYVGIVLMLSGIIVREWAVVTLRKYFSYTVKVREDHKVVRKALYNLVRHPA